MYVVRYINGQGISLLRISKAPKITFKPAFKPMLTSRSTVKDQFVSARSAQKPQWFKKALATSAAALFAVNALPAKASTLPMPEKDKPTLLQRMMGRKPKLLAQTQWVHPQQIADCDYQIGPYANYYNATGGDARSASTAFMGDWQNCLGVQDTPGFRRFMSNRVNNELRGMEQDALEGSRDTIERAWEDCINSGHDEQICDSIKPRI
jgi:hypothetical protein